MGVALTEAMDFLCSILTRMRVVISEGVLEKRTALLIQNFLEQVRTLILYSHRGTMALCSLFLKLMLGLAIVM